GEGGFRPRVRSEAAEARAAAHGARSAGDEGAAGRLPAGRHHPRGCERVERRALVLARERGARQGSGGRGPLIRASYSVPAAAGFAAVASLNPVSRSLSCQSRNASASSRARGAGSTILPFSKYWPVVPDSSGLATSCTIRRPPSSAEMNANRRKMAMSGFVQAGAPDQMAVSTVPGWRQFTVTPVPASFCASSRVYSTLPSLERPYAFIRK